MKNHRSALGWVVVAASVSLAPAARAQTVAVDGSQRFQVIDGFGTMTGSTESQEAWWQQLFFEDLQASIFRVDIEPTFAATYSNLSYCSPWFGQSAPLALPGPDDNDARTYTGPSDYSKAFGGCTAPIAVMGPDIDDNLKYFDFTTPQASQGVIAQMGAAMASQLGGFKLYGSMFSPAPWVKVSSGNKYGGGASPLPPAGVAWPFIWGGNFSGGLLDVSGTPLSVFDDGTGPTSSLTQFARGLAAFLHGFQNAYHTQFYAISLQNELNFEEFYSSATYPQTSQYIAALKAARAELDTHADLKAIRIIGPEDLMGGDAYSMWEYGSGATATAKNLNYLAAVAADPTAQSALAGFAIHAYLENGASSAGANSQQWLYWANGWTTSPASGLPGSVKGFTAYDKPSWMTETSGEMQEWAASSGGGVPDEGALSIALKLHQALTAGQEQAFIYLRLTDGNPADDTHTFTLTDSKQLANGPKYVAAKHFFRYVRPGAQRVAATVTGAPDLLATAYVHDSAGTLTLVLINPTATATTANVSLANGPSGLDAFSTFTSSNGQLWQPSMTTVTGGKLSVMLPAYGIATLYGTGVPVAPDGGPTGGTGGAGAGGSGAGGAGTGASAAGTGGGSAPGAHSGCSCRAASEPPSSPAALLALLGLVTTLRRRARKMNG